MSSTVLLIDVPCLAWRAWHTTGSLSFEDRGTGVLFGVFREAIQLQKRFQTERLVWCFDSVLSKRKEYYPGYKAGREKRTQAELFDREIVKHQMLELEQKHLPRMGYKNVFRSVGYEADDLIAAIINEKSGGTFVVVSSDTDLYQLLQFGKDVEKRVISPHVVQYLPVRKAIYGTAQFREEFCGLEPPRWVEIKAIAGCGTDDIPGVPGVGNKTAAKFLAGLLGKKTAAYRKIVDNAHVKAFNLPLVKLPFEGCPPIILQKDKPNHKGWRSVLKELGMESLLTGF